MENGDNLTRKQLLSLPERNWNEVKKYYSVIVVPTGKKHYSGYALMALVGCNDNLDPYEIAAYCDDIQWMTEVTRYGFRCDMFYKNSCIRFHSSEFDFQIGTSLSTTEIKMIKREKKWSQNVT